MSTRKKDEISCIQLSKETKERLASMGGKGDSFEDIIKKAIDFKPPVSSKTTDTDASEGESNE